MSSSDGTQRQWEYYETPAGNQPVLKEIAKQNFTAHELAHIEEVMENVRLGTQLPREVRSLGDGVFEIKIDVLRRSFRLAFAELDGGLLLLALHLFRKTKGREQNAVRLAKQRLTNWQKRAIDG